MKTENQSRKELPIDEIQALVDTAFLAHNVDKAKQERLLESLYAKGYITERMSYSNASKMEDTRRTICVKLYEHFGGLIPEGVLIKELAVIVGVRPEGFYYYFNSLEKMNRALITEGVYRKNIACIAEALLRRLPVAKDIDPTIKKDVLDDL